MLFNILRYYIPWDFLQRKRAVQKEITLLYGNSSPTNFQLQFKDQLRYSQNRPNIFNYDMLMAQT